MAFRAPQANGRRNLLLVPGRLSHLDSSSSPAALSRAQHRSAKTLSRVGVPSIRFPLRKVVTFDRPPAASVSVERLTASASTTPPPAPNSSRTPSKLTAVLRAVLPIAHVLRSPHPNTRRSPVKWTHTLQQAITRNSRRSTNSPNDYCRVLVARNDARGGDGAIVCRGAGAAQASGTWYDPGMYPHILLTSPPPMCSAGHGNGAEINRTVARTMHRAEAQDEHQAGCAIEVLRPLPAPPPTHMDTSPWTLFHPLQHIRVLCSRSDQGPVILNTAFIHDGSLRWRHS
ncbi:hypothetical protein FA95DRAFT_1558971 [Auriscalpium vulgare]|uniref:Uncharacterized protein n=1 Tax=Auriscalpium vulgare TaxID=40419 RepID=A0ACB8RUH0_9AGAM|nr:hypothetical protein FA95DRAFT_1558971 [Auriscalpium vulgare]